VLEQQHRVGLIAGDNGAVNLALAVPGSCVVNVVGAEPHMFETHTDSVRGPDSCLSRR